MNKIFNWAKENPKLAMISVFAFLFLVAAVCGVGRAEASDIKGGDEFSLPSIACVDSSRRSHVAFLIEVAPSRYFLNAYTYRTIPDPDGEFTEFVQYQSVTLDGSDVTFEFDGLYTALTVAEVVSTGEVDGDLSEWGSFELSEITRTGLNNGIHVCPSPVPPEVNQCDRNTLRIRLGENVVDFDQCFGVGQ